MWTTAGGTQMVGQSGEDVASWSVSHCFLELRGVCVSIHTHNSQGKQQQNFKNMLYVWIICAHAQMLLCVTVMLVILNLTGQVTSHRGAFIIQGHNYSPLCKSIWKHASMIAYTTCTLSLSVSVRRVHRLWSGVHTGGKSSPSWQRWNDIHGWMDPHKISPSINNHDWFQGHKLLQPRVRKSGAAHAKWPGIHQQFLKIPFLYLQKDRR